jgi:hypothetical protein
MEALAVEAGIRSASEAGRPGTTPAHAGGLRLCSCR